MLAFAETAQFDTTCVSNLYDILQSGALYRYDRWSKNIEDCILGQIQMLRKVLAFPRKQPREFSGAVLFQAVSAVWVSKQVSACFRRFAWLVQAGSRRGHLCSVLMTLKEYAV